MLSIDDDSFTEIEPSATRRQNISSPGATSSIFSVMPPSRRRLPPPASRTFDASAAAFRCGRLRLSTFSLLFAGQLRFADFATAEFLQRQNTIFIGAEEPILSRFRLRFIVSVYDGESRLIEYCWT